jgi:bis(5'-nucleosyl)-tetraphosphatase (symmetrical)
MTLAQPGRVDSVLGNHDLHLLAVAYGIRPIHKSDTLDEIMAAPDRDELIAWVRRRPLLIERQGHLLVHAGLLPQWTAHQAASLACEVESMLRSEDCAAFLREMYGNQPDTWSEALTGSDRLRCIINAMTRLRFCTAAGTMDFKMKESGSIDPASGLMPWFDVPGRKTAKDTVVFGHWSALGLQLRPNLIGLDSGCVWGGHLTAVCLQDRSLLQVRCPEFQEHSGKKK